MRVFVSGSRGCVGHAVAQALRSRGHQGSRRGHADGPASLHVDYARPISPADWARRLAALKVDAVVNRVGILQVH